MPVLGFLGGPSLWPGPGKRGYRSKFNPAAPGRGDDPTRSPGRAMTRNRGGVFGPGHPAGRAETDIEWTCIRMCTYMTVRPAVLGTIMMIQRHWQPQVTSLSLKLPQAWLGAGPCH